MANIHVSPGAYFRTLDLSAYTPRLTKSAYGVVGRFRKGPVTPTIIDSPKTFIQVFGEPEKGMYSSMSGLLYLENGDQLYVKRLVGTNATRAVAEIPAGDIVSNEKVMTVDGEDYIFHLTVSHRPLPGTLVLRLGNNVFSDNGSGKMIGGAISTYNNYIDYDSGLFRFTLKEIPDVNDIVEIRYNGKLFIIENENIGSIEGISQTTFAGQLHRTGLYFPDEDFEVVISVGDRVLKGKKEDLDSSHSTLILHSIENTLNDTGTIDLATGNVVLSFDSTVPIDSGTVVYATYDTYQEKSTVVGIGDAKTRAFSGYLNTRVSPGTSSIWVNNVLMSEDQKTGDYVGDKLVYADNSIDYSTGEIKICLSYEPTAGQDISATYSTKAQTLLYLYDEDATSTSFEAQYDMYPVIKGSAEIVVDEDILTDDGEGNLIGDIGNGTIDYQTGKVKINLKSLPIVGTAIRGLYLSKYGNMEMLYHGEYGNGFKAKFIFTEDTGYNLQLWTADQDVNSDQPDEFWNNLNFSDKASDYFITNKVQSYHISIVPEDDANVYLEPLIGQFFETTGGMSDLEHVTVEEAIDGINSFDNPEEYDVNILACPDFAGNKEVASALLRVCETRGDCIAVIDPPSGLTPRQATDWSNGFSSWNLTTKFDSSFGAIYYPWVRALNPGTMASELAPPSTVIPTMYTYTDNTAAAWYAPAGINRGKLVRVSSLERKLTLEDRNLLYGYPNIVNPIITIPGQGVVVWGQKTTQRATTSLDRINVRRLLNYISKVLATAFMELIFEPNDHITRTKYKHIVEPILDEIQANRGLYACSVVCDESLNPASVVENNELHAKIYLQPMKTAEIIETTFVLTRTGADLAG
jgi:hypothetical protein